MNTGPSNLIQIAPGLSDEPSEHVTESRCESEAKFLRRFSMAADIDLGEFRERWASDLCLSFRGGREPQALILVDPASGDTKLG